MRKKDIQFEAPRRFENCIKIRVLLNSSCIGYANLIRSNNTATLADIYMTNHSKTVLKLFKTYQNFRNQGIGTQLLKYIFSYCKSQGITMIEGVAKGDLEKLIPWYKKHGFTIGIENQIYQKIYATKHLKNQGKKT